MSRLEFGHPLGAVPWWAYESSKRARTKLFTVAMRGGFQSFGVSSSITAPAGLSGARNVRVGSGVALGPYCRFLVGGRPDRDETRILLEDGVSIAGFCTISAFERIEIHSNALFARNVYISDHNHAYTDTSRAVRYQGVTKIAPVVVGSGAWLGENVIVTPGVTIGPGAVIAAGAVVTADVPAYSLAAGQPARVRRSWAPTPAATTLTKDPS